MSQEQFAEMIGMSVDFLSLIERGRNAPSFEKLERMASALKVPVAYLFTFDTKGFVGRRRSKQTSGATTRSTLSKPRR